MEAVVQGQWVVPQQFLFLCAEEPLAHRETRPRDSRRVVLNIQLVRKLIRSQFAHFRKKSASDKTEKEDKREIFSKYCKQFSVSW